MIALERIKRNDARLIADMSRHYSAPKGFVGRNICYAVIHSGDYYGAIVGGSSPLHLPGRSPMNLNGVINNLFYHVSPVWGRYPIRNFTVRVLREYMRTVERDWEDKYGDAPVRHETLVELPRTGEIYKRAGFRLVGQTKGFTCKREAGRGTDKWSGKRVWDTENLRPKHVFVYDIL